MKDPRDRNTNPDILAEVSGIGYLSPHGEELKGIAKIEMDILLEHIKRYSWNEQNFILNEIFTLIAGECLERDFS